MKQDKKLSGRLETVRSMHVSVLARCNWKTIFCRHYLYSTRLVKMVTGKPVSRFSTGKWFSERTTGYWIYRTSRRHDPGNADALRCCECHHCHFLAIPASLAVSGRLFWQLVGCRLAPFISAAPVHGQSCISEWKWNWVGLDITVLAVRVAWPPSAAAWSCFSGHTTWLSARCC